MAAAIGWYGPLIDLSRASSHVGDMVQLLVFVQRSQPIEKIIASSRRPILMTNIQVGDDTMPYFVVSVWHKYIGTMIVPGVVILLQNVKIVKFREVLQATTLQISSLTVLAHGSHLITSKDSDQLIAHLQLGGTTREKYSKVIHWIQHTESAMYFVRKTDGDQQSSVQVPKNWKSPEDPKPRNILSITDVLCLHNSCKVVFHAFIGEIFLSSLRNDEAKEQMFLRKTLLKIDKTRIMEDLICLGCTKCGSPMDYRFPLYCSNNSNYVHDIGQIYKPFMSNRQCALVNFMALQICFFYYYQSVLRGLGENRQLNLLTSTVHIGQYQKFSFVCIFNPSFLSSYLSAVAAS
ncbi:uncharacterized protein LOC110024099 isoform X3 [Phalaenopsis equestris]|uniref:uncharacterized protein LOC110024099 isoform X3 n=1 Tax=Phalaenopsis equestris TaxID=78828 RepID=UPI0009E5F735|nr:uncharacterized protein LOC110024099 isoform X3 [Phalaenopsis equestris]